MAGFQNETVEKDEIEGHLSGGFLISFVYPASLVLLLKLPSLELA